MSARDEEAVIAIFDVDGVLLNSWPQHYLFLIHMIIKYGLDLVLPPLEESYGLVANGMINVLRKAGFGEDIAQVIIAEDYSRFGQNYLSPLFPEVENVIDRLGFIMPLAIVSSNEKGNVLKALGPMSLAFSPIVTKGDFATGGKKEGILHCLKKHGVNPAGAVFVGDTMNDYEEALKAEVPFIASGFGWEIRKDAELPFPVGESFHEIGKLVLAHFDIELEW